MEEKYLINMEVTAVWIWPLATDLCEIPKKIIQKDVVKNFACQLLSFLYSSLNEYKTILAMSIQNWPQQEPVWNNV